MAINVINAIFVNFSSASIRKIFNAISVRVFLIIDRCSFVVKNITTSCLIQLHLIEVHTMIIRILLYFIE